MGAMSDLIGRESCIRIGAGGAGGCGEAREGCRRKTISISDKQSDLISDDNLRLD